MQSVARSAVFFALTWSWASAQPPLPEMTGVEGAPFAGTQMVSTVRMAGSGQLISRQTPAVPIYRDSAGRTRTENALIEIQDPVTGFEYRLNPGSHVAYRLRLRDVTKRRKSQSEPDVFPDWSSLYESSPTAYRLRSQEVLKGPDSNGGSRSESSLFPKWRNIYEYSPDITPTRPVSSYKTVREKLGTKYIDGAKAKGVRLTTPMFAFDRRGTMRETWTSTALHVDLYVRIEDLQTDESSERRLSVRRAEPDPALFRVPPGYTIIDIP